MAPYSSLRFAHLFSDVVAVTLHNLPLLMQSWYTCLCQT